MATRTFRGATDSNWNDATNWLEGAIPLISDDVIFDASSPDCVLTAASFARSIDCTGFTGDIDFSGNISLALGFILSATMTTSGTGTVTKTSSGGNWNSNGIVLNANVSLQGGGGFGLSLVGDFYIGGDFSGNAGEKRLYGAGFKMYVGGDLHSFLGTLRSFGPSIVLTGSGKSITNFNGNNIGITFQSGASYTQTTLCALAGVAVFRIESGATFNGVGQTLRVSTFIFTDVDELSLFGSIAFLTSGGQAITLNSNMNVKGDISVISVAGNINGAYTVYCGGNIILSAVALGGSAVIELNGSSNTTISGGLLNISIIVNKSSGATVEILGDITWANNGGIFQVTAGIFNPSTYKFTISNSISSTLNGVSFYDLTINGSATITIDAAITIANILELGSNGNITFQGTEGFTTNTFNYVANAITLQHSVEYIVTNNLSIVGVSSAARAQILSSDYASFNGTIVGTTLTVSSGLSGTIVAGQQVSQSAGTEIPIGLSALLPNRPTIVSGAGSSWTLDIAASPNVSPAIPMGVGRKAKLTFTGTNQNVGFVFTRDIDSGDGNPIYAFDSENDVNMMRTVNWNSLFAPLPGNFGRVSFGL